MKTQWNDAPGGFHPASAPDFLPRRELERVQLGRLQAVVARAYEKVTPVPPPDGGAEASARTSVRSLADLAKLPFTVKTDLRDTYPFGLFAVADGGDRPAARLLRHDRQADRRRLHRGRPRGLDERDGPHASPPAALHRATSSRTPTATASSPAASARTTAARRSAPRSSRSPAATPSGSSWCCRTSASPRSAARRQLLRAPRSSGRKEAKIGFGRLKVGRLRRRALDRGDAQAHRGRDRHQGLRHLRPLRDHRPRRRRSSAPRRTGLHIFEDHFYPEIIDPETGERAARRRRRASSSSPPSRKQAMPMIRYRTRDITAIDPRAVRVRPDASAGSGASAGARDDMFIIRGVNVFPSQVETALLAGRGDPAALPDRPHAREGARRDGGAGRGHAGGLLRHRSARSRGSSSKLEHAIDHVRRASA